MGDKMKEIYIFGCSDDLIEIEGDYRDELCEMDGGRVSIRDYIIIDIRYNFGDWKITIIEDNTPPDWSVKKIGCNDEFLIIKYPDDVEMNVRLVEE